MAIAYDTSSHGNAAGATSLTVSHTMSATANGYLAAVCCIQLATVTGVTFNGVAMTQRLSQVADGNGVQTEYWDLYGGSLPTGTHNIVFSFNASVNCVGGGLSATGVDQTTPRTHTATDPNTGTDNFFGTAVTTAVGELVFAFSGYENGVHVTPDATWTTAFQDESGARRGTAHYATGAGTSINLGDVADVSTRAAVVQVSLQADTGGGGGGGSAKHPRTFPLGVNRGMNRRLG
jgi:hypothetical protein